MVNVNRHDLKKMENILNDQNKFTKKIAVDREKSFDSQKQHLTIIK